MIKKVASFLFFLALVGFAQAQYYWDFGAKIGVSNYLGEMGGVSKPRRNFISDIKLKNTEYSLGGFARYRLKENIGVLAALNYIRISGDDKLTTGYAPRRERNLNFFNNIYELNLRGEYYFYTINDVGGRGSYVLDMRAYGFVGLGGFYHNPKAVDFNGEKVKLRPLMTEGQTKPYSAIGLSIPVGAGLFVTYKKNHRIGLEFAWHMTFTDYLDDVSTDYASNEELGNDPYRIKMASRNWELSDSEIELQRENFKYNPDQETQSIRGETKHDDHYLTTYLTYSYVIRGKSSFYKKKYNYVYGKGTRKRNTRAKF